MEQPTSRDQIPVWRQALEGVGLVTVLTVVVAVAGYLVSLLAALVF